MQLTSIETLLIILAVALGTIITRFTPFILFPESKELPPIITFLGKTLPPAMMGLLVVYSLKNVSVLVSPYGIPEAISLVIITILHLWKRNVLLSIGVGTLVYMFLIQVVFL
ncbi:branched-chain amino acid transporter permease [Anaerorhabdus furcosa]|uniref:Branched-chain amino acid transport protein AzlD n=1 Tax=Anaerorhabdus furcosa TaxID=118967 RepID=A0A1T4KDY6_9FIRM|nr:AzlD domain-containing protein [Anaerorhabdus furcosa]SJZ40619.1 Branched-chain amino acid transport protein AzlD [Anaerorhabdus furcosa]